MYCNECEWYFGYFHCLRLKTHNGTVGYLSIVTCKWWRENILWWTVQLSLCGWERERLVFSNGPTRVGSLFGLSTWRESEREREHFSEMLQMIDQAQNTSHVYCNVMLLLTDDGLPSWQPIVNQKVASRIVRTELKLLLITENNKLSFTNWECKRQ